MEKLYFCRKNEIEKTLKNALDPYICGNYEIKRSTYGKPYVEGNPVFFSISHSGNLGVILICDTPCGVDLETLRPRKITACYGRLTGREKAETGENYEMFLKNWVAKEAYIKYVGGTVATVKRLEFAGGKLYLDGEETDCKITVNNYLDKAVYAVCTGDKR